ncbi:hypothetical protein HK104_006329 [Borealophlyctis nickersoniae]|nr:hypothetical protein HK104_006329 [Borealophlyctis nickersoniae]
MSTGRSFERWAKSPDDVFNRFHFNDKHWFIEFEPPVKPVSTDVLAKIHERVTELLTCQGVADLIESELQPRLQTRMTASGNISSIRFLAQIMQPYGEAITFRAARDVASDMAKGPGDFMVVSNWAVLATVTVAKKDNFIQGRCQSMMQLEAAYEWNQESPPRKDDISEMVGGKTFHGGIKFHLFTDHDQLDDKEMEPLAAVINGIFEEQLKVLKDSKKAPEDSKKVLKESK